MNRFTYEQDLDDNTYKRIRAKIISLWIMSTGMTIIIVSAFARNIIGLSLKEYYLTSLSYSFIGFALIAIGIYIATKWGMSHDI